MRPTTLVAATLLAMLAGSDLRAQTAAAPSKFYLIGNSLTWDTVPSRLAGDVQWHVDCGISLPSIHAKPDTPCVKESTIWPKALAAKQYDVISVQPHYGSTLAQDVATISEWMKLQPKAVFVIHSGWAFHARGEEEFNSYATPGAMEHSPVYMRALVAELRRLHPDREIRQTLAQNLLAQVRDDIAAGRAPFKRIQELYRDSIHMTHGPGRYLMHNAMRRALGQPRSAAGFELDPAAKTYLDGVLDLLETSPQDRALVIEFLAPKQADRSSLLTKLRNAGLRERLTKLLPEIEKAASTHPATLTLEADVNALDGRLISSTSAPSWLALATGDTGAEIFDVPTAIDFYNGNNPLKKKGGRNEKVTDASLKRFVDVPTLKRLDVANCAIEGPGLEHVGKIKSLRDLNLTLTPVRDESLKHLAGLVELRNLGLASTECNGTGFKDLTSLRKLESVNFHHTPLNDEGLTAVCQLPLSGRLWFAHTHFTDAGAASLAQLTQLKRCGIGSKEKGSSGEAVAALAKLPLEELSLLDNQAGPEGVAHAAKIATLKKLDISYGPKVKDDSLALLAQMPVLEELKISSAPITDDGLQQLAASKSLKKLWLGGAKKVTPAGIDRLRKAKPGLVIEAK